MRKYWLFVWCTDVSAEMRYAIYQLLVVALDSVNRVVDKFILDKYVNLSDLGVYSIADKIGGAFYQVNSSIKAAVYPLVYKMVSERDRNAPVVITKVSTLYYLFLTYVAIFFLLLSDAVLRIFTKPELVDLIQYVPMCILIYFLKSQEAVRASGADLAKRNDIQMYFSIPLLIGSITVSYVLTAEYGIFGMITALLLATVVRVGVLIYVGHCLYRREFPWLPILLVTTLSGLTYFCVKQINIELQWVNLTVQISLTTFFFMTTTYLYVLLLNYQASRSASSS